MKLANKLFFLIFLILLISFSSVLGENIVDQKGSNLDFLKIYSNPNIEFNKISYEVMFNDNILDSDNFILEIYKLENNEFNLISTICNQKLSRTDDSVYRKITCDLSKNYSGFYLFKGKIFRNSELIDESVKLLNLNSDFNVEFNNVELGTKIIMHIYEGNLSSNFKVLNEIPKEIISELNEDNWDSYILDYNANYSILKSDPLIAWNIEKRPTDVEYTINKKIDREDLTKFKIEVELEEDSLFSSTLFNYIILFLILLLIIMMVKPKFKKN